jgi:hypothetical protein
VPDSPPPYSEIDPAKQVPARPTTLEITSGRDGVAGGNDVDVRDGEDDDEAAASAAVVGQLSV